MLSRENEQQVQMSIGHITLCSSKEKLGKNWENPLKICLVSRAVSSSARCGGSSQEQLPCRTVGWEPLSLSQSTQLLGDTTLGAVKQFLLIKNPNSNSQREKQTGPCNTTE